MTVRSGPRPAVSGHRYWPGDTAGYHPVSGERGGWHGRERVLGRGNPESVSPGVPANRGVLPPSCPPGLSRSATATRISVFVVIRSPAPPRFLLSTRARIDSCVIWSGQISSSLRSRRRYFGRPGTSASGRGLRAAPCRTPFGRTASGVCTSVLRTSGVRCSGVCVSAGDAAGCAGSGGSRTMARSRAAGHASTAQVPPLRPGLERLRRAPGRRWRLSHEVTDFRSSPSVVPRSLPARPRSMSTATRISVFSVIRSPSPPRWRLRARRILASSSSWSARSRSSLRSRRCHLGICDSVTPAVPASRGPRATRRGAGRRGSGFSTAAAGAASAGASLGGTTGGAAGGAWSTSPSKSATLCRGISSRPSRPRSGRGRAAARYARA